MGYHTFIVDGIGDPQPPLHLWEYSLMWVHPELRMINKWLGGEEGWEFVKILYLACHFHY